jgi:hypothetical protein
MGGNTDCGQRDSGYLAVSTTAWVAGLLKPVQSPDAELEARRWANHEVRVYANQRLSFGEEGKAYGGKAKTSNRTGEIPPSGIIGGHGKRKPWWDCEPVLQSKEQERKPHLKRGAPVLYPNPNGNGEQQARPSLRSNGASPRPYRD